MRGHIGGVGATLVFSALVFSMILCTTTLPALANPSPVVSVSPASQTVGPGDSFSIDIIVDPDGEGLSAGQLYFAFDASVMQVDSVTAGDLFGANYNEVGPFIDNVNGTVEHAIARIGATTPPTPTGTFATITLTMDGDAPQGMSYTLDITDIGLSDENFAEIAGIVINDGSVSVEDVTPPTYSDIEVSPASPTTYAPGQTYTFNITVQDNVAVDTVLFEFDGVNYTDLTQVGSVHSYGLTDLAAGTYNYRWYMNDTSNNWESTTSLSYVINKVETSVNLLLNGTDDNLTIDYGEAVNMSATLSISDTVTLYVDGVNSGSGTGYVENGTTLGVGVHNITASYAGSENYSASSETHWLTVKSPYRWDINEDGTVNYIDLAMLSAHWGETTTPPYPRYDINEDGTVNYIDLAMLSAHWGETY